MGWRRCHVKRSFRGFQVSYQNSDRTAASRGFGVVPHLILSAQQKSILLVQLMYHISRKARYAACLDWPASRTWRGSLNFALVHQTISGKRVLTARGGSFRRSVVRNGTRVL